MPWPSLTPLILTLKLGLWTTLLLFICGVPLAYWLVHGRSFLRLPCRIMVNLPLVLPPIVLGFYLLLLFSPTGTIGCFLEDYFHIRFAFSFAGLVLGSMLFSLPFMLNPMMAGLESLPPSLLEAAYVLGRSRTATLLRVLLPAIRPSLLSALMMTFAHTIGEFGLVLMIGGKIEGITRVASIAVYDEVESFNYRAAHFYSAILLIVSFLLLYLMFLINRRSRTF